MNQKEISELRRRWGYEKNAVSRIYGCFVNGSKEMVSNLDESLDSMSQEEAEKYLGLLKKALSGRLGKNLIDIAFSPKQVMEGGEHRLLSTLRQSALKDGEARNTFYQNVIRSLDMGDSSYLLLLACDAYDVPRRGRDDSVLSDASEEVFSYILCCVCPVKPGKPELGYFPGDNEFHYTTGQVVSAPEMGFLFPAFDDRAANIHNALFYSRKPNELHQEFIDAVFHTDPPMSAAEQREAFEGALSGALEDTYSVEVVQAIQERLTDQIARHKESKDPEPLTMTADDIGNILRDCDIPEERISAFEESCGEQFGAGAALNPANLIDTAKFELKTAQASISVAPEDSYLLETRIIDGRKYILIPAEEAVEVNGQSVRLMPDGAGEPDTTRSEY